MVAPRHGFEPRFTAPKAAVLPLDDRGISSRWDCSYQCTRLLPFAATSLRPGSTMESGRQSGLVFGAVFKTVRRLLKSLVCSIRTVFRQPQSLRWTSRYCLPSPISALSVRLLTPLSRNAEPMVFFSTSICTMIVVSGHGRVEFDGSSFISLASRPFRPSATAVRPGDADLLRSD